MRASHRVFRAQDREPAGRGLRPLRIPGAVPQPPASRDLQAVPTSRQAGGSQEKGRPREERVVAAPRLSGSPAGKLNAVLLTLPTRSAARLRLSLCLISAAGAFPRPGAGATVERRLFA